MIDQDTHIETDHEGMEFSIIHGINFFKFFPSLSLFFLNYSQNHLHIPPVPEISSDKDHRGFFQLI